MINSTSNWRSTDSPWLRELCRELYVTTFFAQNGSRQQKIARLDKSIDKELRQKLEEHGLLEAFNLLGRKFLKFKCLRKNNVNRK